MSCRQRVIDWVTVVARATLRGSWGSIGVVSDGCSRGAAGGAKGAQPLGQGASIVTGVLAPEVSFLWDQSLKNVVPSTGVPASSVLVLLVVMGVPLCRGGGVWDCPFPQHL